MSGASSGGREITSSKIRNLKSQNHMLKTNFDITCNTEELAAFSPSCHVLGRAPWAHRCLTGEDPRRSPGSRGAVPSSCFSSTLEVHPSHLVSLCSVHTAAFRLQPGSQPLAQKPTTNGFCKSGDSTKCPGYSILLKIEVIWPHPIILLLFQATGAWS